MNQSIPFESKSLSVIFSFRNEEDVLPKLIQRIRKVLQKEKNNSVIYQYELIFVNDASTDNSLSVLLDQAKGNSDIKIITMSRCFGVSPCVFAGLEWAKGDAIIYMDADLQDPPEVIPQMLKIWRKNNYGTDIVHTIRKKRKGESKIKLFITRIGYIILNKATSLNLPVEAGDFKLLSRRAVDHISKLKETRPYLRGLVHWIGFNQEYVPYERDARAAGKSKFTVFSWRVFSNFFNSALISFSSAPLKIASAFGLSAIFIDFILMGHAIHQKILGNAVPGWTALMIVILFLGGVQLFCVGIMGLYLNSIYETSKGRPRFIINSTYGFPQNIAQKQ